MNSRSADCGQRPASKASRSSTRATDRSQRSFAGTSRRSTSVRSTATRAPCTGRRRGATTPILPSGIGLRALSLVDLAAWDLAARSAGQSITAYLGGERRPMPATAIIGYPPTLTPAEVEAQVEALLEAGWRRFKQPIAATPDETRARLRAARAVIGPTAGSGWTATGSSRTPPMRSSSRDRSKTSASAGWRTSFRRETRGSSPRFAAARPSRSRWATSRAARITANRSSLTTLSMSSASTSRPTAASRACARRSARSRSAAIPFAPHMFPHTHSQVFSALGYDVPIEWGVPGTGVDQFSDALQQPVVSGRLMEPLAEGAGRRNAAQRTLDRRADRRGRRRAAAGVADTRGGRRREHDRVRSRRVVQADGRDPLVRRRKSRSSSCPGTSRARRISARARRPYSVGAISAMRDDDYLTITYRGHGHALMRGVAMEACFAELMGRSTGCCRGVGGRCTSPTSTSGSSGAFAIVGAGLPIALGAAYSAKLRASTASR